MPIYGERAEILSDAAALEWTYAPNDLHGRTSTRTPFSSSNIPVGVAQYSVRRGFSTPEIVVDGSLLSTSSFTGRYPNPESYVPRLLFSTTTLGGSIWNGPDGARVGAVFAGRLVLEDADGENSFEATFSGRLARWQPNSAGEGSITWIPETLSFMNAESVSYLGGKITLVDDSSPVDPVAGTIWVGVEVDAALSVEVTGDASTVERATLLTRWRPNSPVGRQLNWRGRQWLIESVTVPDRRKTMELGMVRSVEPS